MRAPRRFHFFVRNIHEEEAVGISAKSGEKDFQIFTKDSRGKAEGKVLTQKAGKKRKEGEKTKKYSHENPIAGGGGEILKK